MNIHIILNSHLDPVWLWTWPQGADEVINTARTACNLLDEYPEIHMTRGEAWFYSTVQDYDPELFERIRNHVKSGRWHVVGGWWIQPDCNAPTAESFKKQGEISAEYFKEQLGVNVTVGYNVDSFGHAATLPDFYRGAGIDSYIMMRPGKHEKELPANLFLWESPSGNRITTFRISNAYCTTGPNDRIMVNLDAAIGDANRELGHTMCFVGVGDHGGGPARREIEWLIEHIDYKDDIRLKFSHPHAFFDEVVKSGVALPVVKEELQYHAIGCYSVKHQMRQNMRRAEELAIQAENITACHPREVPVDSRARMNSAWRRILFNQFHDILAGTSLQSAYEHTTDELGQAKAAFRDILVGTTRRLNRQLPACKDQRLLFYNTSTEDFHGYVEFEPWIGYLWAHENEIPCTLTDEQGNSVPFQRITPEAAFRILRLVVNLDIPAGGKRALRIKHDKEAEAGSRIGLLGNKITSGAVAVTMGESGIDSLQHVDEAILKESIVVNVYQDESDTWSHGIDRYSMEPVGAFSGRNDWFTCENGPLMVSRIKRMDYRQSSLVYEVRTYAEENVVRVRLRINWNDRRKIVKLLIPTVLSVDKHLDGCPGGDIERLLDGREYPFFNYLALNGKNVSFAVVSRDVFGADVQPGGIIRLTLLRSPYHAHHQPLSVPDENNYPVCDQGEHEYAISLMPMDEFSLGAVYDEIERQRQPVWFSESTWGM